MSEFAPLILGAIAAIVILRIIAKKAKVPYTWKFLVVAFLVFIVITFPFSMFAMFPIFISIIASLIVIFLIYYYREKIFTKKIKNWLRN